MDHQQYHWGETGYRPVDLQSPDLQPAYPQSACLRTTYPQIASPQPRYPVNVRKFCTIIEDDQVGGQVRSATPQPPLYPLRSRRIHPDYNQYQEVPKPARNPRPYLPTSSLSSRDKTHLWLNDERPYPGIIRLNSPKLHSAPPEDDSSTTAVPSKQLTPARPSGYPALKKVKSVASFLRRVTSRSTLRMSRARRSNSTSCSSLISELTCKGEPSMMIKKEIKVTRSAALTPNSPDTPAQDAQEEIIYQFGTSMVITPDENVKVTKFNADANDESLQRYKQSLGLGGGKDLSDPNDPRVCIIQSLTMESPGRSPVTIDLSQPGSESTLKDKPFKIKEGAKFTMVASFRVQHEILSGLQYVQIVKRKGIKVSKDSEMLGSYAPNTDKQPIYTKRFQEEDAPSGMLARGHYNAISTFVDDDKKKHLQFEWSFDISKDW
ncbi:immunoglobulin E-set [Xylariaceae sp. FL1651]|nr:immunoglobulin E-set [Xylariaceae sp. FL1651]